MNVDYKELIKQAHEHKKRKFCYKCNEHKLLNEFSKSNTMRNGLQSRCKSCEQKYRDDVCPFKRWFDGKKNRAKYNGQEFSIEPEDITGVKIRETITDSITRNRYGTYSRKYISWEAAEYPKVCFKWGIKLDWGKKNLNISGIGGTKRFNSPSLDRIDPKFEYIPGNVRIVSDTYNMAKGSCPPDEWDKVEKKIARSILFGVKND